MSAYNPPIRNLTIFDTLLFREANDGGGSDITIAFLNNNYLKFPTAQGAETLQQTTINGDLTLNQNRIHLGNNSGITNQGSTSIAIGADSGTTNQGAHSVAIGKNCGTTSQGQGSVAIGKDSASSTQGNFSVSIGQFSGFNQGESCVAVGSNSGGSGQKNNAVAIGESSGSINQGISSVAVGHSSGLTNQGNQSVAIGFGAGQTSLAVNAIAIGTSSSSTGTSAIAIGLSSVASATTGIAIGNAASSTGGGINSIAIGTNSASSGTAAISIGFNAGSNAPTNNHNISIGSDAGSNALGRNSIMIGRLAGSHSGMPTNSIQLNATGSNISSQTTASSCVIAPVRSVAQSLEGAAGSGATPAQTNTNHLLLYSSGTGGTLEMTRQPFTYIPWTLILNLDGSQTTFTPSILAGAQSQVRGTLGTPPTASVGANARVRSYYSISGKIMTWHFSYWSGNVAGANGSGTYLYRIPFPEYSTSFPNANMATYIAQFVRDNPTTLATNINNGIRIGTGQVFVAGQTGDTTFSCYYAETNAGPEGSQGFVVLCNDTGTAQQFHSSSFKGYGSTNIYVSFQVQIPLV